MKSERAYIRSVQLIAADTQYTVTVPRGVNSFQFRARTIAALRIASTEGLVAGGAGDVATITSSTPLPVIRSDREASGDLVYYVAAPTANLFIDIIGTQVVDV